MSERAALDSFRAMYVAWLAVAVLVQLRGHLRWVQAQGGERAPLRFLGALAMPRLGPGAFVAVALAFLGCLAAAGVAPWDPAGPLLAASVAALCYFAQVIELPDVRRKPNTVPIILALLGVAYLLSGDRLGGAGSLLMIKLVVAQIYFSSAVVKLRHGGLGWANGTTLRMILLRYHLRNDSRGALWLAQREAWCRLASLLVLGFELTFWLMIPLPQLAWLYLPLGLAFHLGTAVLMRIHYWIYVVPAYLVFVFFR